VCGDKSKAGWEQCDDGNTKGGDGCSTACQLEPFPSCKALLTKFPNTPDGVYPIDPDGSGPIPAANLFCDMKNGGWTLVGNYYDSAGDDMPNETSYVVSGWQQTASGKWDTKASTVDRAWGGNVGSAAVSMAFVEALGKSAGQKHLKMCFVHKDGYDTTCRSSADGSMTLVSYNTGNPKLTKYSGDKLTYTFGRLGGLAGSADSYNMAALTNQSSCIPRKGGIRYEWGVDKELGTFGICDCTAPIVPESHGVWHAWGNGMSYRPDLNDDTELRSGTFNKTPGLQSNPLPATYGFRLYIAP
jgi:cysteine-rich repeat protein